MPNSAGAQERLVHYSCEHPSKSGSKPEVTARWWVHHSWTFCHGAAAAASEPAAPTPQPTRSSTMRSIRMDLPKARA